MYRNNRIATPNIELTIRKADEPNGIRAAVGDTRTFQIEMDDRREFLMVVVYIFHQIKKVTEIIKCLHRSGTRI